MTPLEKRQEEMRIKFHMRKMKKLGFYVAPVKEKPKKKTKPEAIVFRATPGDHSAEKLDRMEELAYRIARRKWQKCL